MTFKRNPLKSAAAALMLASASALVATGPSAAQDPLFAQWDVNGDGYVPPEELECGRSPSRYTNSDALSFNSACAWVVQAMDENRDGAINADEFTAVGRATRREDEVLVVGDKRIRRLSVFITEWDASRPPSMNSGVSIASDTVDLDATLAQTLNEFDRLSREAEETAAGARFEGRGEGDR